MTRLVLLVVIVAATLAFPSLAEPIRDTSWEISSRLLESGVTVRQYLQYIDPNMLSSIPSKFHDVQIEPASRSTGSVRRGERSSLASTPDYIDYATTSKIQARSGSQCYFGVSCTIVWPLFYRIPYISVIGYLNGPGGLWGYCSDSGNNVWRVTENDTIPVQGGKSYSLTGLYFMEFPAGYFPATIVEYSQSPWIYVP